MGLLVSRAGEWRDEGFDDFVADCGAWADHQAKRDFDAEQFEEFLEYVPPGRSAPLVTRARFLVLPDKVAGGLHSLDLSLRWSNRCMSLCSLVLIAVQDGMQTKDLEPYVGANVGILHGRNDGIQTARNADVGRLLRGARLSLPRRAREHREAHRHGRAGKGEIGRWHERHAVQCEHTAPSSRDHARHRSAGGTGRTAVIGRLVEWLFFRGMVDALRWLNTRRSLPLPTNRPAVNPNIPHSPG